VISASSVMASIYTHLSDNTNLCYLGRKWCLPFGLAHAPIRGWCMHQPPT
jgi:hypothetical protein